MLLQSMGILTALVFVLGLISVAVWLAKRFGGATANPRLRIAVEIVQRIPLGPKTGLAVVRVGEKVIAVSVGPDGIRPLFELDEADRQKVIASSQMITPFASSADAGRAIAGFLPNVVGRLFERNAQPFNDHKADAFVAASDALYAANGKASTTITAQSPSLPITAHKPAFSRYVPPAPPSRAKGDREFDDMLNIAMSGATRLAVFAAFVVLSSAALSSTSNAQVAPPVVVPPITPPTPPVAAPATATPTTGTTDKPVQPAVPVATPPAAIAPAIPQPTIVVPKSADSLSARTTGVPPSYVLPKSFERVRTAAIRTATPRPATVGTFPKQAAKSDSAKKKRAAAVAIKGQAQAVNPAPGTSKSNSAQVAPVASGDNDLSKLIPQMDLKMGDSKDGGLRLSGTVGIVVMMGLLTLIPTLLLMMTGFTRILIVLHFLKQAMGTQAAPPAQLLAAMALLLTGFVMAPTFMEMNRTAIEPWMDGKITQVQMMQTGVRPLRIFMEKQTKEADLKTFIQLSRLPRPNTIDDVPLHVLMSAFVASELRTSFYIGFIIYLPFIVIDAVVASVLMSMGMFMLPPAMISMPFKLLLFVLVDGWGLTIRALVESFK